VQAAAVRLDEQGPGWVFNSAGPLGTAPAGCFWADHAGTGLNPEMEARGGLRFDLMRGAEIADNAGEHPPVMGRDTVWMDEDGYMYLVELLQGGARKLKY